MKVLAIFKNQVYNEISCFNFENEEKVFDWWATTPCSEEFKLLSIISLKKTGHKYDLECVREDKYGLILIKNIRIYSKKQAIFAKEAIENEFPNMYKFKITKIY